MKSLNFAQKLFLILLAINIYSDDLDLGDDFSTGETVTAEKFNSKFNKLETVSRLVKDSDLIGTWTCKSVRFRSTTGYTQYTGGFGYYLDGSITFSQNDTESSLTSPKNWSATARLILDNETTSGTYSLFANMLGITESSDDAYTGGTIAEIDLTSDDQLRFIWRREGGGYTPQRIILCDK
jgi:hypothetical protein